MSSSCSSLCNHADTFRGLHMLILPCWESVNEMELPHLVVSLCLGLIFVLNKLQVDSWRE